MPIKLPDKCLRNKNDCTPIAQIESNCKTSYSCCGLNDGTLREIEQDKFTVCFHNDIIDEYSHWDRRDITDMLSVLAQALSVDANMENNNEL